MKTSKKQLSYIKNWKLNNKDKADIANKKYRLASKDRSSNGYWQKKKDKLIKKCKERGLEITLTTEDIKSLRTGICIYCNSKNDYMTIDRMNNKIGYIKSNCASACWWCNKIKGSQLSFEEMIILGKAIKEIKSKNPTAFNYDPNRRV